jgi:hypothetical protein
MSGQLHPNVILDHRISTVKHRIEMKKKEIVELEEQLKKLEKMKH